MWMPCSLILSIYSVFTLSLTFVNTSYVWPLWYVPFFSLALSASLIFVTFLCFNYTGFFLSFSLPCSHLCQKYRGAEAFDTEDEKALIFSQSSLFYWVSPKCCITFVFSIFIVSTLLDRKDIIYNWFFKKQ